MLVTVEFFSLSLMFVLLLSEVDAIVHNGAFVHWLLPYEKLKPTNVTGTQVPTDHTHDAHAHAHAAALSRFDRTR